MLPVKKLVTDEMIESVARLSTKSRNQRWIKRRADWTEVHQGPTSKAPRQKALRQK